MDRYLHCNNAKCGFILDSRINGKSLNGAQIILKKCPECGGDWSATCPSCGQALAMKLVDGLPLSACCERKLSAKAAAA